MSADAERSGTLAVADLAAAFEKGRHSLAPGELTSIFVSSLPSTQALAHSLVAQCVHEDEGPLPFAIAALEQTEGSGRHGRGWTSPAGGGLYASLVLPVPSSERLQQYPVRTATALAEFLNECIRGECRIKWPNDLVVGRRKIGGILVDVMSPPPPATPWAILGLGVNFLTPSVLGGGVATSLLEEAASAGRLEEEFPRLLVRAIAAVWNALHSETDDWVERFARLTAHQPGEKLSFRAANEEISGTFAGFDRHGFLRLTEEEGDAVRVVRSGEIFAW